MTNKKNSTKEDLLKQLKESFETLETKIGQLQNLINEAQAKEAQNQDKLVFHDTSKGFSKPLEDINSFNVVDFESALKGKLEELYPSEGTSSWPTSDANFNYYLNVTDDTKEH